MLLSNALSAATGLAIGHVLSNLLHSDAPILNIDGAFFTLQKDAIALSNENIATRKNAYQNASAAFKVGSDVFHLIKNTEELPTERVPKDVPISKREKYAPDEGKMFTLLHAFNVSFLEGKPQGDALVAYLLSCIAFFLSQGHTEKTWRASFELQNKSDQRMWKAWTDYNDTQK